MTTHSGHDLGWMVDKFVHDTLGVAHAVVLSADGLLMAHSRGVRGDQAERVAALSSAVLSLAVGASGVLGLGGYEQSILRFEDGHLFVTALSNGSALAVVAEADASLGVVAHHMALFAVRVGEYLTPPARHRSGVVQGV
jgi:uncharacterized protein